MHNDAAVFLMQRTPPVYAVIDDSFQLVEAALNFCAFCQEDVEEIVDIREVFEELIGYEAQMLKVLHGKEVWELPHLGRKERFVTIEMMPYQGNLLLQFHDVSDEVTMQQQRLLQNRNETALYSAQLKRLNKELEVRVAEAVEMERQSNLLMIEQSRFATMGEMIANIAHQWRQPLNALNLQLFGLKDAYDYNELDGEFIERFYEKSETLIMSMSETIDDFRHFFKPESSSQRFNAADVVNDAVAMFDELFVDKRISIHSEHDNHCYVDGYKNQLSQVVLNLLGNAKDALMQHRSSDRKINVEVRRMHLRVLISIEDNGGGISESAMERIFEPYFTTKSAQGTGLGLYMSKTIIEVNFQGTITAANGLEGACMSISVPYCEGD